MVNCKLPLTVHSRQQPNEKWAADFGFQVLWLDCLVGRRREKEREREESAKRAWIMWREIILFKNILFERGCIYRKKAFPGHKYELTDVDRWPCGL